MFKIIQTHSLAKYQYIGSECDGGFAEYTVVFTDNIHLINSLLSDAELATFPCAYSTAENLLTKGRVSAEDTVLIMGASGGVSIAAIQLGKIRGAKIIAVVGANKGNFALERGADYVYYRGEKLACNLAEHQITIALDVVGGSYFNIILKNLQIRGRYVSSGAIAGPIVFFDLRDLIYRNLGMIGVTRLESEVFQKLVSYLE